MVQAPAIAFIAVDGFTRNFGPWEKTMLAALCLLRSSPAASFKISLIPIGAPAMLAALALILQRSGFRFVSWNLGRLSYIRSVSEKVVSTKQIVAKASAAKSTAKTMATRP
ncbi:MAG TPA: hypothetical protein VHU22_18915 [Xanthobacteraceae bacterium]|jgi:hypothetical protein|nr:hypothetical protein [Xanthobacteraceae bacterium]